MSYTLVQRASAKRDILAIVDYIASNDHTVAEVASACIATATT
jgi:hypothetical protein